MVGGCNRSLPLRLRHMGKPEGALSPLWVPHQQGDRDSQRTGAGGLHGPLEQWHLSQYWNTSYSIPKQKVILQHPQTSNGLSSWGVSTRAPVAVYRAASTLQQENVQWFPGSSLAGKGLVACQGERATCYKPKRFIWKCDFKSRPFNYTSQMKKRSLLLGIYWWATE